ncbi:MAG: hypothetical protein N2249_01740 [Melioribacter sp.]|nr:hypothetical protein [Melioribacter sp.]
MRKYISSFVCGFSAGVLQIVPIIKNFTCCLIVPAASYIALTLDRKARNIVDKVSMKQSFMIGLMTGIYASIFGSLFDILITFITKTNDVVVAFPELQRMVNNFPVDNEIKRNIINLFQNIRNDILEYGFSWLYSISVIINNFFINSIFGIIGGLISGQIINSRFNNSSG